MRVYVCVNVSLCSCAVVIVMSVSQKHLAAPVQKAGNTIICPPLDHPPCFRNPKAPLLPRCCRDYAYEGFLPKYTLGS